jgi:predicted PurR-regulated permease PerM
MDARIPPAPFDVRQVTPRQAALTTVTIMATAAVFALLWRFQGVVFTLIVAIMLHFAVKPVVERLRKRGVRTDISLLLVYGLVFAILGGFLALILPFLAEQLGAIAARVPEYYDDFRLAMLNSEAGALSSLAMSLPADFSRLPLFNTPAPANGDGAAAPAPDVLTPVINGIVIFIAIFFMAFYWTLDGERIIFGALLRLPEERREGIRELIAEMEAKVGAFYRGQIVLCLFVGALSTLAYLLIGLPYAFILGLLALIFEAVPMIGPLLGAIPAIVIALAVSPEKAVLVIIATVIIQQVENNILVPRVMDKAVGVNPIVSIIAIAAFSVVFGLVGALLAIPLAAIIQIIINRLLFQAPPAAAEAAVAPTSDLAGDLQQTGGRDKISVLRMEARELAEDVRKQLRDAESAKDVRDEHIEDLIEAVALDLDALLAQGDQPAQANNGAIAATAQPELAR